MDDFKSTPDELLAAIKESEAKKGRGRLKVFLGMAPGVGKTYAMLAAGRQEINQGKNVLVGLVETHGRIETQQMLDDLPLLPRKELKYRGTTLTEFDLEAALKKRPKLILVDELAHTNVPGSRHEKRYQDIEELLVAGIDVYTTLNVQHLESRADTVKQITGATIHETVPDSVLSDADTVQLVDLTPIQLRERLEEGKVYLGERANAASANFFKETNLTALREMALRLTAERVDHELRSIRNNYGISAIWRSGERLMVAVGPSPFSARLIRWTRRMAYAMNAHWIALSVETGKELSPENQMRLDENLNLARSLGAEVIVTPGQNIVDTLLRTAHIRNVSQIVIGKPRGNPLQEFLSGGTLVDKLVRRSGQIDIYVVPAEPRTRTARWMEWNLKKQAPPKEYGIALLIFVLLTILGMLLVGSLGYFFPALMYLAAISVMGVFIGWGPIMLFATLSVLSWNFLFIKPLMTFRIEKPEDVMMCLIFFVIALSVGKLTSQLKARERVERERENKSNVLFQLTRAIAAGRSRDEVLNNSSDQLQQLFGFKPLIFLPDEHNQLYLHTKAGKGSIEEKELSVASWAYLNQKSAGRFTDTLPMSKGIYLPLNINDSCMGVIGIQLEPDSRLTVPQKDLLETISTQIALALERENLRASQIDAKLVSESEKLHRALIDSVSHEFKTPLAVIGGISSQLCNAATLNEDDTKALCHEIQIAAQRLQRLVNNLLDVSRIQAGALHLHQDWCDLRDLVDIAMNLTADSRKDHIVTIDIPEDFPLIRVDEKLMEQVLVNLLQNAATHTPKGTSIEIKAEVTGEGADMGEACITLADHGPGIPENLKRESLERFQRGPEPRVNGLGLGLSIARGFIEAHHGRLVLDDTPGGGATFRIHLLWTAPGEVPAE